MEAPRRGLQAPTRLIFRSRHSTSEEILEDGHALTSSQIYEYLSNLMYSRRSKMDPLWNAFLVAGVEKGQPSVCHEEPTTMRCTTVDGP